MKELIWDVHLILVNLLSLAHLHPKGECRNTVSGVDLITAKMTKLPGVIKPC